MLDPSDILLVGRTGLGKSTTGNKLLGTDKATNVVDHFVTGDGSESVTSQCKLLRSYDSDVRVLDTPGFANDRLAKENGPLECNRRIFRWILREQENNNLAISRVLYFLPNRGPLERAEGALQEEIKVMYEFLGEDIFNIMIIIATNQKDKKHQIDFDGEDISMTQTVFTAAFKTITGKQLSKCPPVLYLPFDEADILKRIKCAEVASDEPLKKVQPLVIDVTTQEEIHEAVQKNPGKRLQFGDKCSHCVCKVVYEDTPNDDTPSRLWPVKVVNENGDQVPLKQSKCHPKFILKYTLFLRILGTIVHIASFGIIALIQWFCECTRIPWFTNSEKICQVCKQSCESIGCSSVGKIVNIQTQGEENGKKETSHMTKLDKILGYY